MENDSGVIAIMLVAGAIYFLPSLVAASRRHASETGIVLFNLFLGWTFLGWVLALVWAVTGQPRPIRHAAPKTPAPLRQPPLQARCFHCDGLNPVTARFCSHCGAEQGDGFA